MSSVKYYYDPKTLSYKEYKLSKFRKAKYFVGFVLSSLTFGLILILVLSQFFELPNEKVLKRELQNMEIQFSLLNEKMIEAEKKALKIVGR